MDKKFKNNIKKYLNQFEKILIQVNVDLFLRFLCLFAAFALFSAPLPLLFVLNILLVLAICYTLYELVSIYSELISRFIIRPFHKKLEEFDDHLNRNPAVSERINTDLLMMEFFLYLYWAIKILFTYF